ASGESRREAMPSSFREWALLYHRRVPRGDDAAAPAAGEGTRTAEVRAELARLGAPRGRVRALDVKVMLAETRDGAFAAPGWLFELKYDGFRVVAGREDGTARLVYRRGSESTSVFPEGARAVSSLPYDPVVLDGEVVCLAQRAR